MAAMKITNKNITKKPLTFVIRSKNKKTLMIYFTLPYQISRQSVEKQKSYGTLKYTRLLPFTVFYYFSIYFFQAIDNFEKIKEEKH